MCRDIIRNLNSWENISREDAFVRSVIYTYLRHVINMYRIFSDEKPGTGVPAAIKSDVNVPILYWLENLPMKYAADPCHEISDMFSEALESCGVPFGIGNFMFNLKKFMRWLLNSERVHYDIQTSKYQVIRESSGKDDELLEAFQGYSKSIGQYGEAFSFEFGMSSGERAILNLFAYMNHAKRQMDKTDRTKIIREDNQRRDVKRNVMLIWDEMDAFLHPRWQQMAISRVLKCVKKIFKGHNVQVMFSTHSPMLLSDVPLPHITFLKKVNGRVMTVQKKYQTFADNIYRLYEDSFFVDDSSDENVGDNIWVHGEYADEIIQIASSIMDEVQDKLHKRNASEKKYAYGERMQEAQQIIKLIGEPLLQRIMMGRWQLTSQMLNETDNKI